VAKKVKRLPTSGDRLIDWHFRQIVNILERGIYAIRKKKRLVDTDDRPPRKAIRGLYDPNLEMIFLNASKSQHPTWQDYIETLIHEASHKLHPLSKHRGGIDDIEKILMIKFTDEQKRYLKKFIPKKEVKHDPPPTPPSPPPVTQAPAEIPPESLPEFEENGE